MKQTLSSVWLRLRLNRKWSLNLGLGLLFFFLWGAYKVFPSGDRNNIGKIEEMYLAWKARPEDENLYLELKKALTKAPSRKKALQGEMAEIFLAIGKIDSALGLAKEPVESLYRVLPLYAEFAEISLIIQEKKMQKALEKSISLKEKIKNRDSILFFKNLTRIAFLQGEIGNPAGEMAAWKEFEAFEENHKELAALAKQGLEDRKVTFQSYLDHRKKII